MAKSIVIYFSRADENYFGGSIKNIKKGNTEYIAEYIQDLTGADLFKVEPAKPYAVNYNTCIQEAKDRIHSHDAPFKEAIPDLSDYDTIYIGSPVYWGVMPEELTNALKQHEYTNKTIRVFVTHEGSGLAQIPDQVAKVCKGAKVISPIAISGSQASKSKAKIEAWLKK